MLSRAIQEDSVSALVVLGIIECGETKHGLVMAQAVFDAIIQLQLQHNIPIGLGIIGPEATEAQIDARLEKHARAAVLAAYKML